MKYIYIFLVKILIVSYENVRNKEVGKESYFNMNH